MDWPSTIALEMAKRTYGTGAVYQRRSDSRWVVAVREAGGRRRVKYFSSEPTVSQVRDAVRDMTRRTRSVETKLTVGRHLTQWLDTMRPPRVRPSTWVSYELHVKHLSDLSAIPLARLTPNDVRAHLRAMTDDGHSPRSVAYSLTVLRMALKAAERDRLVTRNVALDVDPPRVAKREPAILTAKEAKKLIDDGDPLWVLLVTTGMRLGEALGLRWRDLGTATVTVSGSLRPVDKRFRSGPRLARVEPKTGAGRRTVTLPVTLKLERPDPPNIEGYVFTSPTGSPRDPRAVGREWEATRARLGFDERVTIHDLRHTAVSLMLASGSTLDDVKRQVGHSTIAMTSDIYGHMVEGRSKEVARRLARTLKTG